MERLRDAQGQASIEMVAAVPILFLIALLAAQLAVVGYAAWAAATAASVGARAEHVGGDTAAAARSALPDPLRDGSRVSTRDGVEVSVRAPALIEWLPRVAVAAHAVLGPGDGRRG